MTNDEMKINLHAEAIDHARRRAPGKLGAIAALFASPAWAQSFPAKPFRRVVREAGVTQE
jgi:hypothetical protein